LVVEQVSLYDAPFLRVDFGTNKGVVDFNSMYCVPVADEGGGDATAPADAPMVSEDASMAPTDTPMAPVQEEGGKRAADGTHTGDPAAKRVRRSGSWAAAGATAEGATRKGGICQHQHIRSKCKECGGAGICQHQRIRSQCKECGGASLCPHQRQRSRCKECGGASICQHQRERSRCKECGGGGICQHQRRRSQCKECRDEADTSMPAGLEELAGAAHAAGSKGL